ncbi:ABC transporter permease [Marinitenerispora sediminis]|uniref:ABC-2 type transporter transmembrane domain-containing protein n=1 Tax=Marinitenerispora sediminis TaxID=1931232 RepID=A0A368TA04_9ACTN|nr:ABC transporter permease [Marinitenerispora sediminis]RCV52806.1 hypothetical protein DEF28_12115 [Marinitenerispora sediminis]RCV59911.1 hypothetical protein DEF23_06095 [Marinitenerispora sediminis]RCV61327.1 hypothetical protein DEF24_04630 [Marinitenerispora sediminis]
MLIIAASVPLGLRVPPVGLALGLLLVILGTGIGTLSYVLAIATKQNHVFAGVLQGISMPLMLLSGVLLPMDMAPTRLYALSRANPLSYVVEAERALLGGQLASGAVPVAFLVATAVAGAAVAGGMRSMRSLAA